MKKPKDVSSQKKTTAPKTKLALAQMNEVNALTQKQDDAFRAFEDGQNLVLEGSAGTGKTYVACAAAFHEMLDTTTPYKKVIILRSAVPTRDIGFLPGGEAEKLEAYARPYEAILNELFKNRGAWEKGIARKQIEFESTSYLRGQTWHNTIVVVDECANLNFHELDSVITRVGNNCRIIFAGDYYQTDFVKENDKKGLGRFLKILDKMESFSIVTFTWEDIVRSDLVRDYIMLKEKAERSNVPVSK